MNYLLFYAIEIFVILIGIAGNITIGGMVAASILYLFEKFGDDVRGNVQLQRLRITAAVLCAFIALVLIRAVPVQVGS